MSSIFISLGSEASEDGKTLFINSAHPLSWPFHCCSEVIATPGGHFLWKHFYILATEFEGAETAPTVFAWAVQ